MSTRTKRIILTITPMQEKALREMMAEDLTNNRSAFLTLLIGKEYRRREDDRRGRGRPPIIKKNLDYTDDVPKTIPHFGKMIGPRELADFEEVLEKKEWLKDKGEKAD